MDDKDLLKAAAKAIGKENWQCSSYYGLSRFDSEGIPYWNPIEDDGDAFRLAVQLEMQVEYLELTGTARARSRCLGHESKWSVEYCMMGDLNTKNPSAAVRRAIVCAAAEIGLTKLSKHTNASTVSSL